MLRDDEDWDPTRVIAGKRRKIQRKADRKRRKIKTERELASRQADPRRLAQHIRTKNQARDTGEAKRAKFIRKKIFSRQRNILTVEVGGWRVSNFFGLRFSL